MHKPHALQRVSSITGSPLQGEIETAASGHITMQKLHGGPLFEDKPTTALLASVGQTAAQAPHRLQSSLVSLSKANAGRTASARPHISIAGRAANV